MKTRTEKDSLGEKQVPADAYYGIQTQRAVENYPISGYSAHPKLIRAMGMIKKAAAMANRELKLVDAKRATAIIEACEEVMAGKLEDQFVVDVYQAGAGVSFHMNANEVLANRAIEILGGQRGNYEVCHPNDHVNFGQSTNDVFPTAMRLAAILLFDEVVQSLGELERSLARKGKAFDHILKSGRTHMMDAVPIRLGQEFAGYATAMRRAARVIREAQEHLRELGLGGSAVGTGVNTHPKYQKLVVQHLSKISGQKLIPSDDLRYAMRPTHAFKRSEHGFCRNSIARAPTRLFYHAGQDQPGDVRVGRDGGFPSGERRPGHSHGSPSRPARTQRDDAGDGLERAAFGRDLEEHDARARGELRGRDYRQRGAVPLLRQRHAFHRCGAEPLYWLRRRG